MANISFFMVVYSGLLYMPSVGALELTVPRPKLLALRSVMS